jgi:hypothetical protein
MLRPVHAVLALGLPAAILACASTPSEGGAARPYSNVITRAELQEVGVRNAYEAIQRLRPRWLTVRGGNRSFQLDTEVVVFQDQMYLGSTDALERMGIDGIYEIRYIDGPTAQATLPGIGDRHVQGAIVIHMSPP